MDRWPLEIFASPVRTELTRIKCGCCKQYHWRPESVRLCYIDRAAREAEAAHEAELERRAAFALDNRWPDYEAVEDAMQYERDRDAYYRDNRVPDHSECNSSCRGLCWHMVEGTV